MSNPLLDSIGESAKSKIVDVIYDLNHVDISLDNPDDRETAIYMLKESIKSLSGLRSIMFKYLDELKNYLPEDPE